MNKLLRKGENWIDCKWERLETTESGTEIQSQGSMPPPQSPYLYSTSKAEKVATTLEGLVCCLFLLLHVFLSGIIYI